MSDFNEISQSAFEYYNNQKNIVFSIQNEQKTINFLKKSEKNEKSMHFSNK